MVRNAHRPCGKDDEDDDRNYGNEDEDLDPEDYLISQGIFPTRGNDFY